MKSAKCILDDGWVIGDGITPYIVAEMGTNHSGNITHAKKMVDEAKRIGCHCVKFQSWSTESLYSDSYYKGNPIAKRIVRSFSLTLDEQKELSEYCKQVEIAFASTPYSKEEVDFLRLTCNVPYIKVASMDLNNEPFLEYIAETGKPIVLATGMSDMEEIKRAVKIIENAGNKNLCLLHCISIYPPETSTIQLKNIIGLKKEFPDYPIGFSDHSIGTEMAVAAVALGACLIEKHLTLDKTKIGMDNNMATEPEEFLKLIEQCTNVYHALGNEEKIVGTDELEQRKKMRRSVVFTRDMKKGEVISFKDLDLKRPGTGIPPSQMKSLVGRVLNKDIEKNTIFLESDLK